MQSLANQWVNGFPDYYKSEITKRAAVLHEARKSPALQKAIKEKCRNDVITFANNFIYTLDPRLVSLNKPALVPFLLFPKQIEYLNLREYCIKNKENLVVLKSRDAGASYITLIHQLHLFLFKDKAAMGLLSKKMDLIDRLGDTGTLFEKLRQIIKYLPKWMLPSDYFSGYARLVNYDNGASIVGFSGEQAGRGSRNLLVDVDECAFITYMNSIAKSLSQTCDTCVLVSTPAGKNNYFAQQYLTSDWQKFRLHWSDDLRKDQIWYKKQCEKLSPLIVRQELDCSFEDSSEGAIFNYLQLKTCLNLWTEIYEAKRPVITAGLDVAVGGKCENVFTVMLGGCILLHQEVINKEDPTDIAIEAHKLTLKYRVNVLVVGVIGVGEGVCSTLARIAEGYQFIPFRENGKCTTEYWEEFDCKAKEIFENIKAEMFYAFSKKIERTFKWVNGLREYDQLELLSINCPTYPKLFSELETIEVIRKQNGKIKVPSKPEYAERGITEFDYADSAMMALAGVYLGHY